VFIEAKNDGDGGENWTTGAIRRAKLQSNHHHQQTNIQFFTGRMPFLLPIQQCRSTKGKALKHLYLINVSVILDSHVLVYFVFCVSVISLDFSLWSVKLNWPHTVVTADAQYYSNTCHHLHHHCELMLCN